MSGTKDVCDAAGLVLDIFDSIEYADGVVEELVQIAAEKEKATLLLDALAYVDNSDMKSEIAFIKKSMDEGYDEFAIFLKDFLTNQAVDFTKSMVKKAIKSYFNLSSTAMGALAIVAMVIEIGFTKLDEGLGWGDTIDAREELLVWYCIANELTDKTALLFDYYGDDTLTYMEFLIKCHLAGGHQYYEIMSADDDNGELLESYNQEKGTSFKSWEEWYRSYSNEITSLRDMLYDDSTYKTWGSNFDSSIEIDYKTERAKVSTDYKNAGYSYSYDGIEWTDETSSYLDLTPGKWATDLWIRCTRTDISTVTDHYIIAARPTIKDTIKAYYVNGKYIVKGITSAGKYCFSDEKKDALYTWEAGTETMEAGTLQVTGEYKKWLCITYNATETSFESRVLNVLVQDSVAASVDNNDDAGTITGTGEYIPGTSITLKVQPKSGYHFIGWYEGDNFLSKELNYTFAIYSSVNFKTQYHSLTHVSAKGATCNSAGNSEYWKCSECNKYFSDAYGNNEITEGSWVIPALGHDYTGVTPTWNWAQNNKYAYAYFKCSECGATERVKTTTITSKVTKAATCTAAGETTYTAKVTFAGNTYKDTNLDKTLPAKTGHKYSNHVCKYCKDVACISTPKLGTITPSTSYIKVTWGSVSGMTKYDKYEVFRKTYGAKKWTSLGTTTKTYYADKTAKAGTAYTYTVRCVNKSGTLISKYDTTGVSSIILATPVITAKAYSSCIKVSWTKIAGASGYRIYRKGGTSKSYTAIATVKSGSTTYYRDKTAKAGVKYTYCVKAYSKAPGKTVWSSASNKVTVKK